MKFDCSFIITEISIRSAKVGVCISFCGFVSNLFWFSLLAENIHDKYRKYRKNNKCNKIPDLEGKEAKNGPEMSSNIAKIAKVTRISHAKSPANTPFYCLKFAPFCGRHSILCIVAVCWWKNEAYTDWYHSILLLSVIINSVTFVTDDFIFAKMERITKLLDKNVYSFILLRARYFT